MRQTRETVLQTALQRLTGAAAAMAFGSVLDHSPEAHAQSEDINITRRDITVVSGNQLEAIQLPYKRAGKLLPYTLPVIPPEGNFSIELQISKAECWYKIAGEFITKPGLGVIVPENTFTVLTAPSDGYITAYGAKEDKTGFTQATRVEFDRGYVFEFNLPTFLLLNPPNDTLPTGYYYAGEPFALVSKNPLPKAKDIRPREYLVKADAFRYGLKPEDIEVLEYPLGNDVFISVTPNNLNDAPSYEFLTPQNLLRDPNNGKYVSYANLRDKQIDVNNAIAKLTPFMQHMVV